MNHNSFISIMKDLSILYIEDDSKVQEYIAEFLGRYTSHLYLAGSAEEGWKLYQEKKPDIILLDINLPGKSGIEFAREVRQTDKDTRIIISTAYTDKAFLLRAVELGLTRYLVKPITGKELIDAFGKAANEFMESKKSILVDLGEGYSYDRQRRILLFHETEIPLRRKEMELLEFFVKNRGQTLSYEILQYEIWDDAPMSKDAIRAQIRNIRKKSHRDIIQNINAVGYRLYKDKR